ncbi:MAG: type II restriction endonuclease [Sphingobacteriales bacterium]|nr:MAG: type II restriction endonuclease [Sphingobacteriales bacterium]
MKLHLYPPKKTLNKAYLKEKVGRAEIELFKKNFSLILSRIDEAESEEHGKNIVADFLKDTWYKEQYEINTKDRKDLVIHTGKTAKEGVGVILEVKKPSNRGEMISATKPNAKALQELILYYLRERIDGGNKFIRHLIVTNVYEWYIIDERWAEQYLYGNLKLRKEYEEFKDSGKTTSFFYDNIARPFLDGLDIEMPCTYFDIREYKKVIENKDRIDDSRLIALFKILSPPHLLKEKFANDSNSLDKGFYEELLHLIGLEEVKDGGKKLIQRKKKGDEASLLENTISKLEERDSIHRLSNPSAYGTSAGERIQNVALELCITWVNRVLFMKLLEAQLAKYHRGNKDYLFLNSNRIQDYDELSNLFFGVLAEKPIARKVRLATKFSTVPYLNSSLFERTPLEAWVLEIALLDNGLLLPIATRTVLKDDKGKRLVGVLPALDYLFRFLDAYDFTSEGSEEIQEENKNLINASVLGLIFEKLNGYKDGSFFTPGSITMYMCRESLRRAVVEKFNQAVHKGRFNKSKPYKSLDDVYNAIDRNLDRQTANTIINSITICDPAVGSGHFLVSALNEIIAIKSELRILTDSEGRLLRDVEISVENDELIVMDDGKLFQYSLNSKESRRIQETLFHEKQLLIENCLFGVDINPNSVKICRLRLWIELLKNAYYTAKSGYKELETLPNIDINIKQGNSLVSRFSLDADLAPALKSLKWGISDYQASVNNYKAAKGKEEKRQLEALIESIKKDFRTEIGKNDPKQKRLIKVSAEHYSKYQAEKLFEIKLTTAQKSEKKKLEAEIQRLETEIAEIKNNRIYENAFEWRFEFPEILDAEGHFVGFDMVIGNPPYVQLQKLSEADKSALEQQQFETYTRTGDLYQLFYELGIRLLKEDSYLCYITSNKWMRTDYGSCTRALLSTKVRTEFVVDFGMAQMFDSATTYTNILLLKKAPAGERIQMCRIKGDYDPTVLLEDYVAFASAEIENPGASSWIAYDKQEYALIRKIEAAGKPLKEWNVQIQYGLKTGFNEAFIIDTNTRNRLVAEDPHSAEIIHPILRGEDVKAYVPEWAGLWVIGTFPSLNLSLGDYPAVENYLLQFQERLTPKPDDWKPSVKQSKWPGRKSGSYEWFETQDSISYYADFLKPKIIYPNMTKYLPFVHDRQQFLTNDKAFIITGSHLEYLVCFFNSSLFKFAFKDYFPELLGDTRELRKVFFDNVPVKDTQNEEWYQSILKAIQEAKAKNISTTELEIRIDEKLFDLYELTAEERSLIWSSPGTTASSLAAISARSFPESV